MSPLRKSSITFWYMKDYNSVISKENRAMERDLSHMGLVDKVQN